MTFLESIGKSFGAGKPADTGVNAAASTAQDASLATAEGNASVVASSEAEVFHAPQQMGDANGNITQRVDNGDGTFSVQGEDLERRFRS